MKIKEHFREFFNWRKNQKRLLLLALFVFIIAGLIFIGYTVTHYITRGEIQATNLAETFVASLPTELITSLEAVPEDINKPEYAKLKEKLMKFADINEDIRFAYLWVEKDGRVYFLADSEPSDSAAYSPPGQEYLDYTLAELRQFVDRKTVITPLATDKWGTWVSVLVPVENSQTGKIIAAFGIDYPAFVWYAEALKHTAHAAVFVLSLIFIFLVYYRSVLSNEALKQKTNKLMVITRKLSESEELFRRVFEQSPIGIAIVNNYRLMSTMNLVFEEITGRSKTELSALEWTEYTYPDDLPEDLDNFAKFKSGHIDGYTIQKRFIKPDGSPVWVKMIVAPLSYENNTGQIREHLCLIEDISEQKMKEDEIRYLYDHDFLTGLYNRRFYEEAKNRIDCEANLPLSVIIGDINGLKLINDAFGHDAGDRLIKATASILLSCCQEQDILARTGGDEFSILMPETKRDEALAMIEKIQTACNDECNKNDANYVNISLGCNTKERMDENENINRVIKIAEDYMYKRKLLEHKSFHSSIIATMKSTMFAISQETEEHAIRLVALSQIIGRRLQLSRSEMDELELLATLHDIGKLGIDGHILNKAGKLTDAEWTEMNKHPEIGFRIAMSIPELMPIAESILCHHERWDGTGYPNGLKGESIPLLSRILAVIDAYDAMTTDRIYQQAISKEAAIDEIKRNAGTQFDPNIVRIFLDETSGV